jgi:hypothetical protein
VQRLAVNRESGPSRFERPRFDQRLKIGVIHLTNF